MTKSKTRVVILQTFLPKYRESVFNELGKLYDLTIVYTLYDKTSDNVSYKKVYMKEKKILTLRWVVGILKLCRQYDVVIFSHDMHYVNYSLIPFLPHKYRTISYGIGIHASYTRRFNLTRKQTLSDKVLKAIMFNADSVLVYFKEVLRFWKVSEEEEAKCFETRNTTEVLPVGDNKTVKDTILFVGTLYKEKCVDVLISSYIKAFFINERPKDFPKLVIVGDGDMKEVLYKMASDNHMEGQIIFKGPIYNEKELCSLHTSALASISPNQAGLSVPKSLGYGVPFITTKDAITGGEILHIVNHNNGVLLDSIDSLTDVISDIYINKSKYKEMGRNALIYYNNNATVNHMVKGFDSAIQYVLKLGK